MLGVIYLFNKMRLHWLQVKIIKMAQGELIQILQGFKLTMHNLINKGKIIAPVFPSTYVLSLDIDFNLIVHNTNANTMP